MNFGFVRNDSGAINIRRCEANRKEQKMKYAILTVSIAAGDFLLKKHMEERGGRENRSVRERLF